MKISSWLRTFSCPTYSASVGGLSERSNCCSSPVAGRAVISRSVSIAMSERALCRRGCGAAFASASVEPPQDAAGDGVDTAFRQRAATDVPVVLHFGAQGEVPREIGLEARTERRPAIGFAAIAERAAAFAASIEQAELAIDGERAVGRPERETDRLPRTRFQLRARVMHLAEIGERDFSRERVVDVVAAEDAYRVGAVDALLRRGAARMPIRLAGPRAGIEVVGRHVLGAHRSGERSGRDRRNAQQFGCFHVLPTCLEAPERAEEPGADIALGQRAA